MTILTPSFLERCFPRRSRRRLHSSTVYKHFLRSIIAAARKVANSRNASIAAEGLLQCNGSLPPPPPPQLCKKQMEKSKIKGLITAPKGGIH